MLEWVRRLSTLVAKWIARLVRGASPTPDGADNAPVSANPYRDASFTQPAHSEDISQFDVRITQPSIPFTVKPTPASVDIIDRVLPAFDAPRMTAVPPVSRRLQLRTSQAFLAKVGIDVVPWPLAARLDQFDAPFAIADFVRALGVDFDGLLDPRAPNFSAEADRLRAACEVLSSAESICLGVPLSLEPLFTVVRADPIAADGVLTSLALAAQTWRTVSGCTLRWPRVAQFAATVRDRLSDWYSVAEEEWAEVCSIAFEYIALQRRLDSALDGIRVQVARLEELEQETPGSIELDLSSILPGVDALIRDLDSGAGEEPEVALAALEALALDLSVNSGSSDGTGTSSTTVENREDWTRVLEVEPDASMDVVKNQFRVLMHRWHPDRHFGMAKVAAEAKAKEITSAYAKLVDYERFTATV
jgi:hypothetical protein